jgi:glycerol-3-phosphate cytidylyltransferase
VKVGITFSTFDFFHAGHVIMLNEAKQQCDYLIAGIQTDPTLDRPDTKNKPVQSIVERQIQVSGCRHVDEVIVYSTEQDVEDILSVYKIDIRILGEEYINIPFTGKDICELREIELYYNERSHKFSTTELRERLRENGTEEKNNRV